MSSYRTKTTHSIAAAVVAAALLALLLSAPAFGHRVNVFAYPEGDRVVVEGYFGGKVKAANCVVEILGSGGTKLLEGKTDLNGIYSFNATEIPQTTADLKILLHAGDGHRAEYTLRWADLRATSKEQGSSLRTHEAAESKDVPVDQPARDLPAVDTVNMKNVVEEALEAKLEPIRRTMAQQQKMLIEQREKGPAIGEIIGGIGWIVGLVGIGAYFMSRNRVRGK